MLKEFITNIVGTGIEGGNGALLDTPDTNLSEKQKLRKRLLKHNVNQGKYADFGPKL